MWKFIFAGLAVVVLALGVEAAMVGGFQDISVNDEGARNALNFAVVEHNRRSNDQYLTKVTDVLKVQRQVVSGMKYLITVRMGRTSCKKNETNEVCEVHPDAANARPFECTFTVWSRVWLNDIRVIKTTC